MFLVLYAIITLLHLYCNHLHSKNRNTINTANLYDEEIDMQKHVAIASNIDLYKSILSLIFILLTVYLLIDYCFDL